MPDEGTVAMAYLESALALDPNYAPVHAALALCHETRFRARFDETELAEGLRHARLALAFGTDDAASLAMAAIVVLHLDRDFGAASGAIARALSLNTSSATALYWGAHVHAWSGDPVVAEDYANRALRLSPFDPLSHEGFQALAAVRVRLGRYDEATAFLAKAVQANPRFSVLHAFHASVLARAGRVDEARVVTRRVLELEPTFRVRLFEDFAGFVDTELRDTIMAGMLQAGLPE